MSGARNAFSIDSSIAQAPFYASEPASSAELVGGRVSAVVAAFGDLPGLRRGDRGGWAFGGATGAAGRPEWPPHRPRPSPDGRELEHLGRAAGRLDLGRGALAERVGHDEERPRHVAVAEDLERLVERANQPGRGQDVGRDRNRGRPVPTLAALPPSISGMSRMPVSARAEMRPTFTISYSTRNMFRKPRSFGRRTWIGVWPPSNQGWIVPPVRDF